MSATALLRFAQGLNIGLDGQVLIGETGTTLVVENVNNTDVASWQIDLVATPAGSALPPATPYAYNNSSSTVVAAFLPDVPGSYRVVLTVWDAVNRTGPHDVDIRNFVVVEPKHGFVVPPYQQDPPPLPTLASGLAGAKPNEMNIGGSELGWTGNGTDGLLAQQLKTVDGGFYDSDIQSSSPGEILTVVGSAGDAPIFHPIHMVTDGTNLVIPPGSSFIFGQVGSTIWTRVNLADLSVYDWKLTTPFQAVTNAYMAPPAWVSVVIADLVAVGTDIWTVGWLTTSSAGFLFKSTSTGSLTIPAQTPPPVVISADKVVSIEYDPTGAKLWICAYDSGDIIKVDPVTTTPTVYNSGSSNLVCMRIDQNAANHGGVKRGFVIDTLSNIMRFRLDTGFGGEPVLNVTSPRALAVNQDGGFVYCVQGAALVRIYDKDITAPQSGKDFGLVFDEISWIDIDPNNPNDLWMVGLSQSVTGGLSGPSWNNVLVARVDAGSLNIKSLVELNTNAGGGRSVANGGSGLGASPVVGRIRFIDGKVWVADPQAVFYEGDIGLPGGEGAVYSLSGGGVGELVAGTDGAVSSVSDAGASISTVRFGATTITGLSGIDASMVGSFITLSGATNPDNNGSFSVTAVLSSTSLVYTNPKAVESDTVDWTVADRRFTSAGSTFITAGVLAGDLISMQHSIWEVQSVTSQTQLKVVNPYGFAAPATGLTFAIYRPLQKSTIPIAGAKSLELVDPSWKTFIPRFECSDGLAQLGNGTFTGQYRIVADVVEVRVQLTRGSTTTFGLQFFYAPYPDDLVTLAAIDSMGEAVQNLAIGQAGGVGTTIAIEQFGPGQAFFNVNPDSLIPDPGNTITLNYSLSLRKA